MVRECLRATAAEGFIALAAARAAGFRADQLLVDPGFGFGKTMAHNLTLLRHLREITATDTAVLVGLSRKSLLGTLTGRSATERVHGSVALAVLITLIVAEALLATQTLPLGDSARVRGLLPTVISASLARVTASKLSRPARSSASTSKASRESKCA